MFVFQCLFLSFPRSVIGKGYGVMGCMGRIAHVCVDAWVYCINSWEMDGRMIYLVEEFFLAVCFLLFWFFCCFRFSSFSTFVVLVPRFLTLLTLLSGRQIPIGRVTMIVMGQYLNTQNQEYMPIVS